MVSRTQTPRLGQEYDMLEYRLNQSQDMPYIKGRGIRVDSLYLFDYCWGLTPQQIADGRGLSVEAVNQSIRWCQMNIGVVNIVVNQERERLGLEHVEFR